MENTRDYTTGRLSSHFLVLALPLIAGNILQQLYNTLDAVVIGRFASSSEFAAVGVASSVMNLFLFAIVGFCTGISILLAQAYGGQKMELFRKYHFISTVIGGTVIIVLSVAGLILLPSLLRAIQTPQSLTDYVLHYLRVIIGGLIVSYLYNFYAALLRSIGKAGIALLALFIAIILNFGLDILFVAIFSMGIAGAAWATMLAQSFSVLFCVIYLHFFAPDTWFHRDQMRWNSKLTYQLFKISCVTSIHQLSLYLGKLLVQASVNSAGEEMIAAYTATTRIEGFANSFGDSGSAATSVLIAQNCGAGKKERVRQTFWISLIILILLGVISSTIMYVSANATASFLLGDDSAALTEAVSYLKIISIFYIFCFTGNTFAGYFEGVGRVKVPFIGALSHISLRVVLSYFWIHTMGLDGVAYATGIGWVLVNIGWSLVLILPKVHQPFRRRPFHPLLHLHPSDLPDKSVL